MERGKFPTFPSKLLLFGEYAILKDQRALAIPYHHYSGGLTDKGVVKNNINSFLNHLSHSISTFSFLSKTKIENLIKQEVGFSSDIPIGYGLGSSAALTAAVLDYCSNDRVEYSVPQLKEYFAAMESYFHGNSSGLDPLVSYYKKGVLVDDSKIELLEIDNIDLSYIYLYDSNIKRSTKSFVNEFVKMAEDPIYNELYMSNSKAIDSIVNSDKTQTIDHVAKISMFQYQHFQQMIPDSVKPIWQRGLDSGKYYMKLCGAGGGGYFLVFSDHVGNDAIFKKIKG